MEDMEKKPASKTPLAASLLAKDSKPAMGAKPMVSKPAAKPMAKGKKHKHVHIERHDDGTHTMRYTSKDGGPEVSHTAKDLDEVHDSLEQHVGDPNGDEGQMQAQGGEPQGGQPQPMAQPQPQPQMQPQGV
jgi:hypothetical protein